VLHQLYFDNTFLCTVLAEIWPVMERCTVISKKEVFYLWPFGLGCWLWGTIFIDRLNVERAQSTINNTGDIIHKNKVHSANYCTVMC
jgi:lysophosphatidate acyltransferase